MKSRLRSSWVVLMAIVLFIISIVSGVIASLRILNDTSREGIAWAVLGILMSLVGMTLLIIGGILFFTFLLTI